MNPAGKILQPGVPPAIEFRHRRENSFHAATVTRQAPGGMVLVDQIGGPSLVQWGAIMLAGLNPSLTAAQATERAFEILATAADFEIAKAKEQAEKARGSIVANGSNRNPSGPPG